MPRRRAWRAGSSRETCRHCGGRGAVVSGGGFFQVRQTCPVCGGAGTHRHASLPDVRRAAAASKARKRLTPADPEGRGDGSRLRLAGKGEGGGGGGPAGDLYVVLHVREHELFERRGDDLFCEVPCRSTSPRWAARSKCRRSTATPSSSWRRHGDGQGFRLRGKGMPNVEGYGHGDLHAQVIVEVPVQSERQAEEAAQGAGGRRARRATTRRGRASRKGRGFYERKRTIGGEEWPKPPRHAPRFIDPSCME